MGAKAIASLNLSTSFSSIERLVKNDEIDGVMLMGIHPGVLIQEHRPKNILNDLDDLKNLLVNSKASKMIGLDGAVSFESVKSLFNAGINNFICGSSSIFKEVDFNNSEDEIFEKIKENLMKIKNLIS
jgi:pentose-5-phosphate-3-epimerase